MDPRAWRQSVQRRLNDHLGRAMSLTTGLDLMEADCDLEDTSDDEPSLLCLDDLEQDNSDYEPGGEGEPTMGACERHPTSRESPWGRSGKLTVSRGGRPSGRVPAPPLQATTSAKPKYQHGGDVLDEPHDGRDDDEYELGRTEHVDQRLAGKVNMEPSRERA